MVFGFSLGFALALVLATMSACTPPCRALAEKVCACEPSRYLEDACVQQLNASDDLGVSDAEESVCDDLLDRCTCDALERGESEACGLSKVPATE